jgi:hypothetical protein
MDLTTQIATIVKMIAHPNLKFSVVTSMNSSTFKRRWVLDGIWSDKANVWGYISTDGSWLVV